MSGFQASDTMPKIGHVTDLREQWLVRTDGALAHRLQDREISSHLCENRYRNQQIREDFPVALSEQRGIENEVHMREMARRRQADIDAEIAREMAEINLRRQRRHHNDLIQQPTSSRAAPTAVPSPAATPSTSIPLAPVNLDVDPEELGLSPFELEEMRRRLEQEEIDARLARELSSEVHDQDILLADMRCAVEAQDGELAKLLQEREYKKLQKAKEKARQKALLKKQQRQSQQQAPDNVQTQTTLCDAYCNPRDIIRENKLRQCKSVDSDLHYVEPFEKEIIQSKAEALQSKEFSKQFYQPEPGPSQIFHAHSRSFESDKHSIPSAQSLVSLQHRQPPPPPTSGKKPRFPDPVSIRPASHYPTDEASPTNSNQSNISHSYSENNNLYSSTFPPDHSSIGSQRISIDQPDTSKRLSVISDITAENLAKKKSKQADMQKKRRGCKIQ